MRRPLIRQIAVGVSVTVAAAAIAGAALSSHGRGHGKRATAPAVRLDEGGGPGMGHRGGPGGHHPGGLPGLSLASTYLGVSVADIRAALKSGKTLASLVSSPKTVDGLVAALVAPIKKRLDDAVTAGKLTAAQETTMLTEITSHTTDVVNGKAVFGGGPGGHGRGHGHGHGPGGFGPPMGGPPSGGTTTAGAHF